jgi:hypothetical protein
MYIAYLYESGKFEVNKPIVETKWYDFNKAEEFLKEIIKKRSYCGIKSDNYMGLISDNGELREVVHNDLLCERYLEKGYINLMLGYVYRACVELGISEDNDRYIFEFTYDKENELKNLVIHKSGDEEGKKMSRRSKSVVKALVMLGIFTRNLNVNRGILVKKMAFVPKLVTDRDDLFGSYYRHEDNSVRLMIKG